MSFEHLPDGLGIGTATPRLSWTLAPGSNRQTAYEVQLTTDGEELATSRIDSDEQVLVAWPGPPLVSRARVGVRVRVWTPGHDAPSAWSEKRLVEAGLLDPTDWRAVPVAAAWAEDPEGIANLP